MESGTQEFTRVNRPESSAASYYNLLAPWYDFLAASEKKFIKQGLNILDAQASERILEIGFGTGYAQKLLIPLLQDGLSAGVDLSIGMAQVAWAKLKKNGFTERSGLVNSNSLPLPFQTHSFDGLFSSFTLELFDTPQIPQVLNECYRVLRPGGRLVIVSLSKDKPLPWMGRLYEGLHNRYPRFLDCRPIPVMDLVEKAGYTIQQNLETSMWGLPVMLVKAKRTQ
jgi:demethylmenaquinone methyltransferase/2-methoxy-6-polyprenyl-1,4-benzoquinol methylase